MQPEMPASETALFHQCPLGGCTNLTADPRQPCGDCQAAAGGLIQPAVASLAVSEFLARQREGDERLREILAERRNMVPLDEAS